MISQRITYAADGSATLLIQADATAVPELIGLAEELNLRSTVRTEAPIHRMNDPEGNGGTPSVPDL